MLQDFEQINLEEIEYDAQPKRNNKKRIITTVICVLLVVILAITAALLVKKYVITTFIVDGISMYPTLDGGNKGLHEGSSEQERTNGDLLYLNKIASIERNDIVVFYSSALSQYLVKRVIAIGGDHLEIKNNKVYVNGVLLDEPYINVEGMSTEDLDVVIQEGYIFCMGDNRNHSTDSRSFGQISIDDVVGSCFLIKTTSGNLVSP